MANDSKIIMERLRIPRTTKSFVRKENLSGEFHGVGKEFQSEETKDDAGINKTLVKISVIVREESFPIPLKYVDVIRSTHTDLDVAREKRIDDYWNDDGNKSWSDSWTGFPRFTLLNGTPPKGYMWPGMRLTRNQNDITSRSQMV